MSENLIRPYEISVWEDELTQDGFVEKKLAVIGSDTMTGLNKVYDPVFIKNSNGERTLTFSLKYKYFDPYSGNEGIINPFVSLLTNERKVKLHYDGEWYEFIVKEHVESSEDYSWDYTCTDAFVLELSKTGYNITFDAELNNNQGTARELTEKTLENTDWQLGTINVGRQLVAEPIYKAVLSNTETVTIFNTDTNEEASEVPSNIYLFYSYIKNKDGNFVQFIEYDESKEYKIDSKNVITDTNYRILDKLVYDEETQSFKKNDDVIISLVTNIEGEDVDPLENRFQANRLVYNQLTTYDPVKQRTVDRFKVKDSDLEIYRYIDYVYTTSNVVTNFITNGENFNSLEDGTLQGWNPYTDNTDTVRPLQLVTRPELGNSIPLANLNSLFQIEGFLKIKFNGPKTITDNKIYNTVFNSGFENNSSIIQSVAKGQKFVFRWRAGERDTERLLPTDADLKQLKSLKSLRLMVAKYTQDDPSPYRYYYKHIKPEDVILDFNEGTPVELNNEIKGGELKEAYRLTGDTQIVPNKTYYTKIGEGDETEYRSVADPIAADLKNYYELYHNYVIDDVVQAPSTKYIYIVEENDVLKQYVWSGDSEDFVIRNEYNYLPYYYLIAEANRAIPNSMFTDTSTRIGIFLYTIDNASTQAAIVSEDFGEELYESIEAIIDPVTNTTVQVNIYGENGTLTHTIDDIVAGTNREITTEEFTFKYDKTTNKITASDTNGISKYVISYAEIKPIYIQDLQLTRFIPDGIDGITPVLNGNIPVAMSDYTEYYYKKPVAGALEEDVEVYTDLDKLKEALNLQDSEIEPMYNENSEKYLSITAAQSNCFNILQTIAETFECWVDLVVDHDESGHITYTNGVPNKYVYLKEYAGDDNWAGFKYGINLESIERTINSDEIVTKLIVDQSQADYTDEGFVSIGSAKSNVSGESYILNFNYFYSQGLLNREIAESDKNELNKKLAEINQLLVEKETKRRELDTALIQLGSERDTYNELVASAQELKTTALEDFFLTTNQTYEDYRAIHDTLEESEQLTNNESILNILGDLYINSATINNYSGILTNVNQEYLHTKEELKGAQNYKIKIWVGKDNSLVRHVFVELDDYLSDVQVNLGEYHESSSPNKKFFDITEDNDTIPLILNAPNGYFFKDGDTQVSSLTYYINDFKVVTYRIICDKTISGIEDEIEDLLEQKNDLIKEFNSKYSRFIQEGTWSSTDYIDSELYYLDALQVGNTSAEPVISYTINVTEISELEGLEWYSFDAGDKSYIEDTEFFGWKIDNIGTEQEPNFIYTPAREEVIVSEVEWHLDEPDKNVITVQNYKTRFEDLFQRISATVQTVQYNEATYAKVSTLLDANGTINQNVLLDSLNNISGKQYSLTTDGSIKIDGNSITIQNLTNPTNNVKITNEGIEISSDGGDTWRTVLDGQGINIGAVYTGSLNTNEVIIGNKENPSFRWDSYGISAFKFDGTDEDEPYDLQTFVRFDQYGLYGIKDNGSFKAKSLSDIIDKAHFAVTWDGFFIRNNYEGGGRVEITSEDDFQVIDGANINRIKIGSWLDGNNNRVYGINIKDSSNNPVFSTDNNGNLIITGTINATGGNFSDLVTVGTEDPYIKIDGANALISTSNYGAEGAGWMINAAGDAVFENITARGAIKTAVFEYAEIQAVGGIFIFRPSSTIRSATIDGNDLIVTVEKPILFKEGDWCKISNYTSVGEADDPDIDIDDDQESSQDILQNNGLTNVYPISDITIEGNKTYITLEGAAAMIGSNGAVASELDIIGGALVDMGKDPDDSDYQGGIHNYGIGINSSDNSVNLPARAISLFETNVNKNAISDEPKITYNYRGILGTLPPMSNGVDSTIYSNMVGTQGIYTDNMYLGDANQYVAFYTDNNDKKLEIRANEIFFKSDGGWTNVANAADATQGGHFIFKGTDTIKEGIVTTHAGAGVIQNKSNDPAEWGYNTWIGSNGIQLRRGETTDATLNINGLVLSKGGIKAGEPNTDNFVYMSSEPYGENYSVNNSSFNDWKEIVGTKLGIRSDGTLYAAGAHIADSIETDKLRIGQWINFGHRVKLCDGQYVLSQDVEVFNDKVYFIQIDSNEYKQIIPIGSENPSSEGWYEYNEVVPNDWKNNGKIYYLAAKTEDDYIEIIPDDNTVFSGQYYLTEDSSIDVNKVYYILESDSYVRVANPVVSELSNYYELQGLFYEVDTNAPQMVIGKKDDFAVTVDNTQITFWYAHQKIAFINGDRMEIPRSVMLEEMLIGQDKWSWREHEGNLQLKWIGNE